MSMKNTTTIRLMLALAFFTLTVTGTPNALGDEKAKVCRPELSEVKQVELGQEHIFSWTCPEEKMTGKGYYIVFIRPSGTYALFRVDDKSRSFKFKPDIAGQWRWIVINTDPDRTKPDVESKAGIFQVRIPLH
jgi:hypothetical protein